MLARRRMDLYGATLEDFAQVKVKNARHGLDNPNARYRKESSVEDVLASPVVSDPLRLLDICATSDGAAALIVASKSFAEKHLGSVEGVPSVRAVSLSNAAIPAASARITGHRNGFHRGGGRARAGVQGPDPRRRLRRGRHRPGGPQPGRGVRPLDRAGTRLVRAPRAVREGRGRVAAAQRRHHHRRARSRSIRPAGWPASARRSRPRPSRRCAS